MTQRDREPPFDRNAEMAVLGGMLIGEAQNAIPRALAKMPAGAETFHLEKHRRFARALLRMHELGHAIDVVTIAAELRETGDFEAVGGMDFIADLLDAVPTASNIEYHARIIAEHAVLRSLIDRCTLTIQNVHERNGRPVVEILGEAEAAIFAVAQARAVGGFARLASYAQEALNRLESDEEAALPIGLADVDRMLRGGMRRKGLYVVAARPSMGKSSLTMGAAVENALRGRRVAYFSVEGGELETWERAVSNISATDLALITDGRHAAPHVRESAQAMVKQAIQHLNASPFYVDAASRTVSEMSAHARRLHHELGGLDLIVVDHIHEMSGPGEGENEIISAIAQGLKRLAKDLDVPVLAAAQLNRNVESRPDKRPMMSDLRGSGGIEEKADAVMFIYRPEYYHGPRDKDGNSLEGLAEIIMGKQRNGATGTVNVFFRKECTRFEDFAHNRDERGLHAA